MVIVCHQAQAFHHLPAPVSVLASYMQTGVFLFFIASAFTLCNSAVERSDECNKIRNFFLRRFFRIAPLYYVGIGLFWIIKSFLPQLVRGYVSAFTGVDLIANLLLLHGLLPATFEGLVPGGWSIGTEWAFYLMFPVLFPACCWLRDLWGWKALILPLTALTAAAGLVVTNVGMNNGIYWFWYDSIVNQLPIFMVGIILFMATNEGAFRPNLWRDVPGFLLAGSVALWALYVHLFGILPLTSAISFVFLFNILRITSTSYGLVERIGRASYSMYVFHTIFAVCITRAILSSVEIPDSLITAAFGIACVASVSATFLVGRASEKLIEHPFIALGRRLSELHWSETKSGSERPSAPKGG